MQTYQASEAKTRFLQILDDVEDGATVIVTRHGRTVAWIVPPQDAEQGRVNRAIEAMRELRKRTKPTSIEEILAMRDEGRM